MHRIKVVGLKELNRGTFHHIAIIKSNWHSRLQQQGNKISFGRTVLPNLTTWNRATNERLLETRNNKSSSKCSTVNKQKRASMNQLTNQVSTQVTEPDARGGKKNRPVAIFRHRAIHSARHSTANEWNWTKEFQSCADPRKMSRCADN